jgi:hypothetical protein
MFENWFKPFTTLLESKMSTSLVQVLIALTNQTLPLQAGAAAQASIAAVVTDSTGVAQSTVQLTGNESPTPWAFTTSVAPGAGSVSFTPMDSNGSPITIDGNGNPVVALVVPFTETGTGTGGTFQSPVSATVTPVGSPPATPAFRRS